MADFDEAFTYLMKFEDSHPVSGKVTIDNGGLTKYGISQKAYPMVNIEDLSINDAKSLYKRDYWKFENVKDQAIANKCFQIVVNLGNNGGARLIQHCLIAFSAAHAINYIDGVIGPDTVAFINNISTVDFLISLDTAQLMHYINAYGGDIKKVPGGLIYRAKS